MRRGLVVLAAPQPSKQALHLVEYGGQINWFPGHMRRATLEMLHKLKQMDFVIEVRDARVPFLCANPEFEAKVDKRKRVLLFNKADLAEPAPLRKAQRHFLQQGILTAVVRANAEAFRSCEPLQKLVRQIVVQMNLKREFQTLPVMGMVVGLPNVGKSAVINQLRRACPDRHLLQGRLGKKAQEGALPGVTRQLQWVEVSAHPHCVLVDTPGVMVKRVPRVEDGLKLTLCGAIKDSVVGESNLAQYLLNFLNYHGLEKRYMNLYGVSTPCDDWQDLAPAVQRKIRPHGPPGVDLQAAAQHVLAQFRNGRLGRMMLDDVDACIANSAWTRAQTRRQRYAPDPAADAAHPEPQPGTGPGNFAAAEGG